MAQNPTVTKEHGHLQKRNTPSTSLRSLETQVPLGPVGYVSPADVPAPVLWSLQPAEREQEILADAWCTGGSSLCDLPYCGHYTAQH